MYPVFVHSFHPDPLILPQSGNSAALRLVEVEAEAVEEEWPSLGQPVHVLNVDPCWASYSGGDGGRRRRKLDCNAHLCRRECQKRTRWAYL